MHEFPPKPWMVNTFSTFAIQVACLLVGLLAIAFLLRPKRKPLFLDATIMLVVGLVLSVIYTIGTKANPGFLFLTWFSVLCGMIFNWRKLKKTKGKADVWYSFLSFFTLFMFVFCFCMIPVSGSQEAAYRTHCKNNLKQIGIALHNYHDVFDQLPTYREGQPPRSWRVNLLPYVDSSPLFDRYDVDEEWNAGSNLEIAKTKIPVYRCPSDPFNDRGEEFPWTAYAALVGEEAIWHSDTSLSFKEIPDGSTNTLVVVEACGQRIPWSQPKDVFLKETELKINTPGTEVGRSEGALSSFHQGGTQVLFADGRIRFLSSNIDPETLKALTTASGDETLGEF